MLELANEELRVVCLEPEADRALLGSRFCTGGYIWQVHDRRGGPLLSGPEGPAPHPDPFNGHGLPEAFRHRTRSGAPLTWEQGRGLAPGIGVLATGADATVVVQEPCSWHVTALHDRLVFRTEQADGPRGYALTRTIQLLDRHVLSVTRFANVGSAPLALQWFAHPFFPLDAGGLVRADLPTGCSLAANPGFALDGCTLRLSRSFRGTTDDQFALLGWPAGRELRVRVEHPRLRDLTFETNFAPSECPIWANGHTFSIEPYQDLRLGPAEVRHWSLRYVFGRPA